MELRLLRSFVNVAETKSFSMAANRLGEVGIDTHVGVSLHKYQCCHANVWSYKRAYAYTQFAGHTVVESVDLLFAILGLLQYFLGTRQ